MTLKIEKQNVFFHIVIERAKGIKAKEKIKLYLYRFSAGMKAILEKDAYGIRHFKYIEKAQNSRQLSLQI